MYKREKISKPEFFEAENVNLKRMLILECNRTRMQPACSSVNLLDAVSVLASVGTLVLYCQAELYLTNRIEYLPCKSRQWI